MGAYDSILARHGVSREDVEASVEYYANHPDEYAAIHDSVLLILEGVGDSLDVGRTDKTPSIPLVEM